jgi:hypothetical protein
MLKDVSCLILVFLEVILYVIELVAKIQQGYGYCENILVDIELIYTRCLRAVMDKK